MSTHDFRNSIVNAMLTIKTALRIIDDSGHDESPDIVEFRNKLYDAYELTDPLLKRMYSKKRTPLNLVE